MTPTATTTNFATHAFDRRSGSGWYVVEVGADWRGDVVAALGLVLSGQDRMVVASQYAEPDAPPRLIGPIVASVAAGS